MKFQYNLEVLNWRYFVFQVCWKKNKHNFRIFFLLLLKIEISYDISNIDHFLSIQISYRWNWPIRSPSKGLNYQRYREGEYYPVLPVYKILDLSKLKVSADEKNESNQKFQTCFVKSRKPCGKRRKCWLPAFSPFPTMFVKDFYSRP